MRLYKQGIQCLLSLCIMFATCSFAAPTKENGVEAAFIRNLAASGVNFTKTKDTLDITINQSTAIAALPELEAKGILPKISDTERHRIPLSIAVVVMGVSYTVVILDALYGSNSNLDKLHVQASVISPLSTQKQMCYSFDYSRDRYKKLDLNKMTPKEFMLSIPSFIFTDWCRTTMAKEGKHR